MAGQSPENHANMKTTTTWKADLAFTSRFENHAIELNGASNEQGERLGFSPKALLLSGLAGCSGIDVVEILNKMKVEFTALEIEAEAEQTETNPKVFTGIEITYKVATAAENLDKVKRAVSLSLEKYCGVSAMLSKHCTITPHIQILSSGI